MLEACEANGIRAFACDPVGACFHGLCRSRTYVFVWCLRCLFARVHKFTLTLETFDATVLATGGTILCIVFVVECIPVVFPPTIVALFGIVSSLDPFLDWIKGEHEAREEEQKRIEAQKELDSHRHVRLQREVLRRIFLEVDVDGSGGLSESELELVVLKLFDENNNSRGTASQEINHSERPTTNELKRERDYLLSNIDQNRTNEITFQEMDE